MKRVACALLLALPLVLAGCLEVDQHPVWKNGSYDGKPDQPPEMTHFHGSRFAWWAAVADRNQMQNEYLRAP